METVVKKNNLIPIFFVIIFTLFGHITSQPTTNAIVFGQSACLEGPLGLYGKIIQRSILARINRINEQGGIKGRQLKLVSLNDNSDPRITQKNTESLMRDGIDMFIGNTGTRSVLKLLPLIREGKIALFFPWSGDAQLHDAKLTHIINGAGLLHPQLTTLVAYIQKNIKIKKIAIFHADDDFSTDASHDLISILNEHNIQPTAVAAYNRFTLDIATPAATLLASDPKIVICLATSMPTVKLINNFFIKGNYGTTFFGIDSTLFVSEIVQARGAEFYYSSAVPNPTTSQIALAQDYRNDLKKYFPYETPNVLGFSYYISTSIVIDAIKNISGKPTKEKILTAIENMKQHSIDGFDVTFDPTNRHAFGQEISIIKG